ncbi:MAG: hypothetical protein HA491_03955 [Candidatus Verstraetearchaeota archaeon]|nr:hypothetical protein [Candidatus Verstraetearchaeota archaeon]
MVRGLILTVLNSRSKYDIMGGVREVTDSTVGVFVVGGGGVVPNPPSYDLALKFLERPDELSAEEALMLLSRVRGVFVGDPSRLEATNKCWRLVRLCDKLVERLDLRSSWCSCVGLTKDSAGKRVGFERIPVPELVLSGNVVVGIELFGLRCRRVEFRDVPLIKLKEERPPHSMIDVLANIVEVQVGDVVENLEGVVEELGDVVERAIKEEGERLRALVDEALRDGVAYVELDKLADEVFNQLCRKVGSYVLGLREAAKRKLMI